MGVSLPMQKLDRLAENFAAYLQQDLGLKKGERIAIQMPNVLQFPIAFIGALRAGLIVVNTNPLYTPREMEHQFRDAEISAIVIVANFAHNLETSCISSLRSNISSLHNLGDMLGGLKGTLVNFVVKRIKKMVPAYHLPQALSFKDALKKGASLKLAKVDLQLSDIAVLAVYRWNNRNFERSTIVTRQYYCT